MDRMTYVAVRIASVCGLSLVLFSAMSARAATQPKLQSQQSPSAQSDTSKPSGQAGQTSQSGGTAPSAQSGQNAPEQPQPTPSPETKPKNEKKDKSSEDEPESKLKISVVTADTNKPVGNASVYIRYPEGRSFFTHKEKDAEMNFKTNQDGSVKVPDVPRGKVLIQVIAPGLHTYGKYYDIEKDEEEIQIKLEKPPSWY